MKRVKKVTAWQGRSSATGGFLMVAALVCVAALARGQEEAKEKNRMFSRGAIDMTQPTRITSERFEFDYKQMVAIFDEQVKVVHPQFYLEADRVFVFIDGTNDVKHILALGDVVMTNENRRAVCDKAMFSKAEGTLVLTGVNRSAQLTRGMDGVAGERITLWLEDERMVVEGQTGSEFVIGPTTLKQGRDDKPEKPTKDKPAEAPEKPAEDGPSLYTDPEATL